MKAWRDKTQITTMLTQTQDNHMIHPRNCREMPMPRIKIRKQWKKRNHANLEQMNIRKQETKEQRRNPHAKKTAQTELAQYIESQPEMPAEMELSRDGRKQLAELTIEYHPGKKSRTRPERRNAARTKKGNIHASTATDPSDQRWGNSTISDDAQTAKM